MIIKGRKQLLKFVAVLVFLPFLFSCKNKANRQSFVSSLDQIDALINQKQFKEAVKELSNLEKNALSSWDNLGLFKRYVFIEENERAQKLLEKAIKNNPENLELIAVYTNFLLRLGKAELACKAGENLLGTKYGSIYSEAVFQSAYNAAENKDLIKVFNSEEYYPIYLDAYRGSGNNAWLRNCSLLHLANGAFESAASVYPDEIIEPMDGYFWSLVMYDAHRFGDCVNYAEAAKSLVKTGNQVNQVIYPVLILEADAYTRLKDEDNAENVRKELISGIQVSDSTEKWKLPENVSSSALSILFTNSARFAFENNDNQTASDYLVFLVNEWPDFVPSLSLYADFAVQTSAGREENVIQAAIRDEGTCTLEMEQFDTRVQLPVSDALIRIQESLSRTHDPVLYIISLNLENRLNRNLSEKDKLVKIWKVLEDNAISPGVYPDELLDYSLRFLLVNDYQDEAYNLLKTQIYRKFNIPVETSFSEACVNHIKDFNSKEKVFASYFVAKSCIKNSSIALYEDIVFEQNVVTGSKILSPQSDDYSCMNLAMIYHSIGYDDKALELYGLVEGRSSDLKLKSLIMYRMALIYSENDDLRNARRCAEYSVVLDSRNLDARLLLSKLKL